MCRTTDSLGHLQKDRSSLKIKAFFIRFSGLKSCKNLPDSLTLLYLPCIDNGADELLVRGCKVEPVSPAFLTLHRVVNVKTKKGEAVFGSRDPVRASGVVRFEVYLRDERILKGMFRKDIKEEEWKLECDQWGLQSTEVFVGGGCAADVAVAVDGEMAAPLSGRVEMVLKRQQNHKRREGTDRLDVIPEESEEGDVDDRPAVSRLEGGGDELGLEEDCGPDCDMMMDMGMGMGMGMDLDGLKWAIDLGIFAVCLGVGYLVSKASVRSLRHLKLF